MNKITINNGSFKLDEVDLDHGTVTIGRSADNDIVIDDSAVSSYHAKLVTFFNVTYIEDLNSTNGTIINGRQVNKFTLKTGDIVLLGKHQLMFQGTRKVEKDAVSDSTMVMSPTEVTEVMDKMLEVKASTDNPDPIKPVDIKIPKPAPIYEPEPEPEVVTAAQPVVTAAQPIEQQPISSETPIATAMDYSDSATPTNEIEEKPAPQPSPSRPSAQPQREVELSFNAYDEEELELSDVTTEFDFSSSRPNRIRKATIDFQLDETIEDVAVMEKIKPQTPPPQTATPQARKPDLADATDATIVRQRTNSPAQAPIQKKTPTPQKNQQRPTPNANTNAAAAKPAARKTNNTNTQSAQARRQQPAPPPKRKILEDPSVSFGDSMNNYNMGGISESDRVMQYQEKAAARNKATAVGDRTLLKQIITGDREYSPSRNKFEVIQIILGFVIFTIIALIAFASF